MIKIKKQNKQKTIEWTLLIFNISLLGIWAVKETIALRNILIFLTVLTSIYYIYIKNKNKNIIDYSIKLDLLTILILIMPFIWVVIHYFYFSVDISLQKKELLSTWLRAILASFIGFVIGLVFKKNPEKILLLGIGLFINFIIIIFQYIPLTIKYNSIFNPDFDNYIYQNKINTVMMGSIMIAGIGGALVDYFRNSIIVNIKLKIIYWFIALFLGMWTYTYVFNSRNGMIMLLVLTLFILINLFYYSHKMRKITSMSHKSFSIIVVIVTVIITIQFFYKHIEYNNNWKNFVTDLIIAKDTNKYQNWKNIEQFGYPQRDDSSEVSRSTYDRISWAIIGIKTIKENPFGIGVLSYPMSKIPGMPQNISTHSGWVELGLAFGMPMLIFIFILLSLIILNAVINNNNLKITIMTYVLTIIIFYTIGEATIKHGLEILFYLLGLLSGVSINKNYATNIAKHP